MASAKVQKVMTQPINLIFRFLQNVRKQPLHRSEPLPRCNHHACASPPPAHGSALTPARNPRPPARPPAATLPTNPQKSRIQVWLYEQVNVRIEGRIIGFDEYMNVVLDDAEELDLKKQARKSLGRILLKGDTITLMMNTERS
jgi:small nuclear ribonucleoprotein E